jgi:cell cycle sensor histidine kinase DivJ
MSVDVKDEQVILKKAKMEVLLSLLGEAREEADNLRSKLEKYKGALQATRLIMGHELKRPTTAISGYLDLALEDLEMWTGCDAVENIKKARNDCQMLNELNEFFLELLRIDNDKENLHVRKIDIQAFLLGIIEDLPQKLKARGRLRIDVAPDVRYIHFNPNALKLILVNVIENALINSPLTSEVQVSVRQTPDKRAKTSGDIMTIEVVDHGVGIPPEYLQKVFSPFVRVPANKGEGTGLGLTLVRSLIGLYDGDVSIKSLKDQGTTVYLVLPAVQQDT